LNNNELSMKQKEMCANFATTLIFNTEPPLSLLCAMPRFNAVNSEEAICAADPHRGTVLQEH